LPLLAQGAAALTVIAGSFGVTALDKSVTLSVDGKSSSAHSFGSTVADVLDGQDITVGARDQVVPSLGSKVKDGDTITVRYARKLVVTVDGVVKEYWTTATTVDAALKDLGLRADGAVISASRSQTLGRQGLTFSVTTPKDVTLTVGGQAQPLTTTSATIGDLLKDQGVAIGDKDRINPGADTAVANGMSIVVNRVELRDTTSTEEIAFGTTETTDDSLYTDQKKIVTKGVAGERTITVQQVVVDGQVESESQTGSTVTREPVAQVVAKGTQARPAPAPAAPAPAPATPPVAGSTWPMPPCGTASPSASPAATGASTPATATTAACSSPTRPGSATAVATSPSVPTWPLGSSRSPSPTGSTPTRAWASGAARAEPPHDHAVCRAPTRAHGIPLCARLE